MLNVNTHLILTSDDGINITVEEIVDNGSIPCNPNEFISYAIEWKYFQGQTVGL